MFPEYYDIHSNVAKLAFRLDCKPTEAGLETIGKAYLRIIAKSVRPDVWPGTDALGKGFGLAKGTGVETVNKAGVVLVRAIEKVRNASSAAGGGA